MKAAMGEGRPIGDTRDRRLLWALIGLGAVLRLAAIRPDAALHSDELFQYLEQAYRLTTGLGIVPWEYREGLRAPLVPLLLSVPMRIGIEAIGSNLGGVMAVRIAVALGGVAMIPAAWSIGSRWSRRHAIVAAAVTALWFENILFAAHVLTEPLASAAFFVGAAVLMTPEAKRGRLFGGGAALGAAVILRMQYAPALALFALLVVPWRRWGWVIAGGLLPLVAAGAVDVAAGQWPFEWMARYFEANIIEGRAAAFGVAPPSMYFLWLLLEWSFALPLIAGFALLSGRRGWPLLAAALAAIALHMAVGHKEYRFIALSVSTLVLLGAIGSASAMERWLAIDPGSTRARYATGGLVLCWAAVSAMLWAAGPGMMRVEQIHRPTIGLIRSAAADPAICGVALEATYYWRFSYALAGRPVPAYLLSGAELRNTQVITELSPGFDAGIFPDRTAMPAGYRKKACVAEGEGRNCLFIRPGKCGFAPGLEQHGLQRTIESRGL
jgi:hypothetical protein